MKADNTVKQTEWTEDILNYKCEKTT